MTDSGLARDLGFALSPGELLRAAGIVPDPWQNDLLLERPPRALLLCCRQAGKSTAAAAAALHEAIYHPGSLTLMIAPTARQAVELFRKSQQLLSSLKVPPVSVSNTISGLELANGSRIVCLPASEDTIRGYSSVSLIILDEAARIDDEIYFALRPMLIISGGRLLALSTPDGQRGWFYEAWVRDDDVWTKVKITAGDCPRIDPARLAEERATMTPAFYAAEYECVFGDAVDSIFFLEDLEAAIDHTLTPLFEGGW
jgi:Terminase large subunit, T4likevirus-type, N-terminal